MRDKQGKSKKFQKNIALVVEKAVFNFLLFLLLFSYC